MAPRVACAPPLGVQCNATTSADRPMFTKCPACGSLNVRRSSIRPLESSGITRLRSPYRCRDCSERFWVVSKRLNYLAVFGGLVIVAAASAWNMVGVPSEPARDSDVSTADTQVFAEAISRAEHEDPPAELKLAHMYAHGEGVTADKKAAQTWLERAAQHGDSDAQYELGNALREGVGTLQDYETAAKWLQLAAARGHGPAQYALAEMYRAGTGLAPDKAKAYLWFNLAAAQDVPGAAVQRDVLLRGLTPAEVLQAQAEARRLSELAARQSTQAR